MAPMIDMVFLLLVFFMTVSTLTQEERVPLDLAESERSNIPDDRSGRGTISIAQGGEDAVELFIGPQEVTFAEMRSRLKAALAENPDLEINVRATAEMPFAEIKKILTACAELGAYKIVYATYQAP